MKNNHQLRADLNKLVNLGQRFLLLGLVRGQGMLDKRSRPKQGTVLSNCFDEIKDCQRGQLEEQNSIEFATIR